MNKRTWDILARYVSEEYGIKVVITDACRGPQINLETKTIELPERIKEENALAALSSLIHEAAHMKYSTILPTKMLTKTNLEHFILNAIEDVRIDRKNFNLLPNIYDFYDKFMKDHVATKENKENVAKQHMLVRCLMHLIIDRTYFSGYAWDKEAEKFIDDNGIGIIFDHAIDDIEHHNWDAVRQAILDIKNKFSIPSGMEKKIKIQQGGGDGQGDGKGTGQGVACAGTGDGGTGDKQPGSSNSGQGNNEIKDPEGFLRPASVWGEGSGLRGPGGSEFNPNELAEQTKRKFIETLTLKEKVVTNKGRKLDTKNLLALYTGKIEKLFKDISIEKVRMSKIVFCIDASGSMQGQLFDKNTLKKTLARTVKAMTEILDEVRETEGLNVDYDVIAFDSRAHKLDKETWMQDYYKINGGTNLLRPVEMGIKILSDSEIDGNKLIIIVTDGCVSNADLESVKGLLLQHNSDIKALIIGIGASQRYTNMFGDNNILCMEHADQILMEAIQELLD